MHFPPDERFEFVKLEVPSTWLSLESGGKWLGGKFYRAPGKSPSSKLGVLDKGGSAPGTKPLDDGGGKYSAKEKAAIMKREEEMKAKEMGIEVKPEKKKGKRKSPVSGISSSIDLTEDKSGNPQVIHKPTGLGVFTFSPGTTMDGLKEASPAVAKQRAKALAQELSQYDWINDADLPKNRPHLKQIAIHVEKARFGYDMKEAEASVNKWWKS